MGKITLLFSGQGSQYVGMGKELTEKNPKLKGITEIGSDILGFDLQKIINEGTETELAQTEISQPSIYAVSLIALESLIDGNDSLYDFTAGHSLGEYAALTAAGVLDIENGFKAIKIRSEAMSLAAKKNPGGMAAVIGASVSLIEEVCNEISKTHYVTPVNYNSPQQTVIAGTVEGLEKAIAILTEKGVKRIIKLNVSAAFHSLLMKEASEIFREKISAVTFNKCKKDFYCNVRGSKLSELVTYSGGDYTEFIQNYLASHICSPVRFTDELTAMNNDGADIFIEVGPGKVLTGLVKKTLTNVKTANAEDIKSLETARELLKS